MKQLLKMCEIVGVRDVAEDAIRAMDPRIDLEDPKVWDRIMEEDTSYKGNAFITANDEVGIADVSRVVDFDASCAGSSSTRTYRFVANHDEDDYDEPPFCR